VRIQTNQALLLDIRELVEKLVRDERLALANLTAEQKDLIKTEPARMKGLTVRKADGSLDYASDQSRIVGILIPVAFLMLMFMVIMMTASPLMQGVLEEKMQRIAEVLLGSVTPFQLMLGK